MIDFSARKLLLAGVIAAVSGTAGAAEMATKPEAEGMVRKAVAYLKANGRDKMSKKDGQFVDRDLYITIYTTDGTVRAHGANARMIGKNTLEMKDVDGKAFIKERMAIAAKKAPFWQEYKFTNPVSGKIEPKAMYCIPEADLVLCGGVYLK
jgi:signal transduction histidine kinase